MVVRPIAGAKARVWACRALATLSTISWMTSPAGCCPKDAVEVFAQPVQPLGGGEALKITNRRRVPVEECLGLRRLRVPPLGEILALGRLIPDRPMDFDRPPLEAG